MYQNRLLALKRSFYLLSIFLFITHQPVIIKNSLLIDTADWLWPLFFLKYVKITPDGYIAIYLIVILASLPQFFFSKLLWARILGATSWVFYFCMLNSFGKINNDYTCWVMASVFFIFASDKNFYFIIYLCRAYILATYFSSGLWKLKFLLEHIFSGGSLGVAVKMLPEHMSRSLLEGQILVQPLFDIVSMYPAVSFVLWIGVIAMQLSTFFALFAGTKALHLWGLVLVLFHVSTQVFMGIGFLPAIVLVIYFFIICPKEKS